MRVLADKDEFIAVHGESPLAKIVGFQPWRNLFFSGICSLFEDLLAIASCLNIQVFTEIFCMSWICKLCPIWCGARYWNLLIRVQEDGTLDWKLTTKTTRHGDENAEFFLFQQVCAYMFA